MNDSFQALYFVLTIQTVLMIVVAYPETSLYLFRRLKKKVAGIKARRVIRKSAKTNRKLEKYRIIELKKMK